MTLVQRNRVAAHMNRYFIEIEKKYALEFPAVSASDAFLVSLDAMAVALRDELEKCADSMQMTKAIRSHWTLFAVGCKNDKRSRP